MKTILLTGAEGQLGQSLQKIAPAYPVTLVPCSRTILDITQPAVIEELLAKYQPEAVINAAAYTAVDKAETEPERAFAINATGVKYLAEACARQDIPLVHISTDYVFDGKKEGAYVEEDPIHPLSVYGQSKWEGEVMLRQTWHKHLIIRVSWVFSKFRENFVKSMIRLMQTREELKIVNDQYGCPTYAPDIATAILQALAKPCWGTYHYCGTPAVSRYDFAQAIYHCAQRYTSLQLQRLLPIGTQEFPTPAQRPFNSVLECDLFARTFDIIPRSWQSGLARTCQSLLISQRSSYA